MKARNTFLEVLVALVASLFWSAGAQAQPIAAAPALVEATNNASRIWLTFGLDRVALLQYRPVADIPLWQYLASLVYIFLAFYVSKMLDFFIRERVQKWTSKTNTKLDDLLVELVRGPVKIVTFVILLHIGMKVYSWPDSLAAFLSAGLKIIVACSITYVLLKAIDLLLGLWRERTVTEENEEFGKHLLPIIGKTIKAFVLVVMVLVTSQNLGLNVTGLIASLSIGGLALGLAAQDTLANLFGAAAVLIDKPFKVGDNIRLDSVEGTVESIGFRSTQIRNLDGHLVTIPNKTMGNATITNISRRANIKTVSNIGLTYDTSPETVQKALAILGEIYRAHPKTKEVLLSFDKFTDSTLNLLVIHWWTGTDYKAYLAGMQELNLAIKKRFDAEKIDFAFPSQTLYVKSESAAPPSAIPKARS